jgi:hypothetical protein
VYWLVVAFFAFGLVSWISGYYSAPQRVSQAERMAKARKKGYARWYAAQVAQIEAERVERADRQRRARAPMNLLPSDYKP